MEKIIDRFYNGSMSNFGFGTLSNGKIPSVLTTNKIFTPKQTHQNSIYQNRPINSAYNNNYNSKNTLYSLPKTQYSMGLNVPTVSGPLNTQAVTLPNLPNYNDTLTQTQTTKKYFKPEILKVHMLEQKIKEMEEKNKEDKKRMREIIEGNVLNVNDPPKNNNNNTNNNIDNVNPNSLEQAMNNIQMQSAGMLSEKQALRRKQIQYELNQARRKLLSDRADYGGGIKDDDDDDEEEEEEEEDEEDEDNKLFKNIPIGKKDTKNRRMALMNKTKSKMADETPNINPAQKEADDFIKSIPEHAAIQLQADNFKVRANLAQVKDGFRNIRNQLEDKLETLQLNQRLNYEKIRYIIEQGGNNKMKAGIKKIIDGEDIDMNNVHDDIPEYVSNLPDLIEEKLKKAEEIRKNQENQEQLEEQQMIEDEIGQKFNVTTQESDINNIDLQNENITNPWEIINNENNYEYIPGRKTTTNNKLNVLNKTNTNGTKGNFNPKRLFTEEEENVFINKIANKIIQNLNMGPQKMLTTQNTKNTKNTKNNNIMVNISNLNTQKNSVNKNNEDDGAGWLDNESKSKTKKKSKNKKSDKKNDKKSKKNKKNKKKPSDDDEESEENESSEEEEKEEKEEEESVDISSVPKTVSGSKSKSKNNKNISSANKTQSKSKSQKKPIPLQSKSKSQSKNNKKNKKIKEESDEEDNEEEEDEKEDESDDDEEEEDEEEEEKEDKKNKKAKKSKSRK